MKVQASSCRAVVIADLVGSRAAPDRRALHRRVVAVLDEANRRLPVVEPLAVTVGDELQGAFARVGDALHATLWLRLALLGGEPAADVRLGVGWGAVTPVDDAAGIVDGPAWWVARDAVVHVEEQAARVGMRHRRTSYRADAPGPDPALVEALLVTRDQLVGGLSARSARLLLGMVERRTQQELAEAEGISASAVSQRVRRDGLAALLAAEELLGGIRDDGKGECR